MEPLTILIRVAIAALIIANVGALVFAFLRFRATRDLPPTIAEPVQAPLNDDGITPAARLRDLESQFKSIERAFNDLHTTVETRHRSLTGLISKKLGGRALPVEEPDDSEPILTAPPNAFQKLAELEAQQAPPPPPQQQQRRHLRRF